VKRLLEVVSPKDTLGIIIDADPDSMASALALRRLVWRKVKQVRIYHVNPINRADNIAFVSLLDIEQERIGLLKRATITRWAIVDSQPNHRKEFMKYPYDIIIDHHPLQSTSSASFLDIQEEFGATSTILTEYLRAAKIVPSKRLATALLYGIMTDTAHFVRKSLPNDINAFIYLYSIANMNIIRKLESSAITRKTLAKIHMAIERLTFLDGVVYVYMGKVDNADLLVIIADLFIRIVEAQWSVVSGVFRGKLIVILRNATLRGDAGKMGKRLFEDWGGSAGGHSGAARAEIPLSELSKRVQNISHLDLLVKQKLKEIPR
jgi:nanoRNase/pAp phosphatase (c-di-AMP/oligoRNAs hydrolase)